MTEEYSKENRRFYKTFCEKYEKNIDDAKVFFYREKLKFNLETEEGMASQNNLFKKYIEGLQWVLYYYYTGIKHWGWYYPYHYPPMISDLKNIVSIIGKNKIESFDDIVEENKPFFPMQQLLAILPMASRKILPEPYRILM
jgi:5'-3' exoribonuclease 1